MRQESTATSTTRFMIVAAPGMAMAVSAVAKGEVPATMEVQGAMDTMNSIDRM